MFMGECRQLKLFNMFRAEHDNSDGRQSREGMSIKLELEHEVYGWSFVGTIVGRGLEVVEGTGGALSDSN